MTKLLRIAALLMAFPALVSLGPSQQKEINITTREPGTYTLEELYKTADIVALVKVVSGDTEHYDMAVYKAEAVEGFKGASAKQIVYFGPFIGQRLGWEYVLFLRKEDKKHSPNEPSGINYGMITPAVVFNEGYSSMEASYQCVFHDSKLAGGCDYAVRVCTDYIKLPKSIPVFPAKAENADFGCRWTRKVDFVRHLRTMAQTAR
jgi:hypothetical protein